MSYYNQEENDRKVELFLDGETTICDSILDENGYKDYSFVRSSDYTFNAYSDTDTDEIDFTIDPSHPLFMPFLHFLGNKKEIRVHSDFRREEYNDLCYIGVKFVDDEMLLSFVNKIPGEKNSIDKFNYCIINVMYDLRSRLDSENTDIKDRLNMLFNESTEEMTSEYHQMNVFELVRKKK